MFYVYFWLRRDGTPYYIGKGKDMRAFIHRGHHINPPTENDRIILELYDSEEDAFFVERFFVALFGRKDLGAGCLLNRTDGGQGPAGKIISAETRQKLRNYFKGKKNPPRTQEHCRNIALAKLGAKNPHYGKSPSLETLKKRSIALSGANNPFFGRKHSEETRAHWSRIRRGRRRGDRLS